MNEFIHSISLRFSGGLSQKPKMNLYFSARQNLLANLAVLTARGLNEAVEQHKIKNNTT